MYPTKHFPHSSLALALLCALAAPAFAGPPGGSNAGASSGPVLIDQARAEGGGVTTGDAAGFPVTTSQPGSYRLVGNLTVSDPSLSAIQITADGATLDLNGYTLQGPVVCTAPTAFAQAPALGTSTARHLGDHPAVVVQRLQRTVGYDYTSKFYPHPAWLYLLRASPDELERMHLAARAAVIDTTPDDEIAHGPTARR